MTIASGRLWISNSDTIILYNIEINFFEAFHSKDWGRPVFHFLISVTMSAILLAISLLRENLHNWNLRTLQMGKVEKLP